MDIQKIIASAEALAPLVGELAAKFDPKIEGAVDVIVKLGPIVDDLAQKIEAIRAKAEVDPELMQQVADANVAADEKLIQN